VGHAEPLRAELQAFVSAVRSGTPSPVSGEEGVAGLEIAIKCLQQRSGQAASTTQQRGPRRVIG
jgi:predicted dehydrogenase